MSNNNKIRLQLWLGIGMWLYVMAIVGWFFIDDEVSRFIILSGLCWLSFLPYGVLTLFMSGRN